ncbi:helix-turn-helix transcriptional regulator [Mycoplasmatota bacterium]|nr:helix-turn-helix transcriptional regulator [Mycoplasmatota bacterium]
MEFGQKLLSLRKEKGLSQEELGGQLMVSRQTVSKWELGDSTPEMDKLILISEFFDISLDELVKGSDTSNLNIKNIGTSESKLSIQKKGIYHIIILLVKIFGILLLIDFLVMIIYFIVNGFPT